MTIVLFAKGVAVLFSLLCFVYGIARVVFSDDF